VARALISVSDKRGVVELARAFVARGVEVCSTGGTAALLEREGVPVTPVERITGFPEMLDGRVKTLHPAIHAGVLARRDDPAHMAAIERAGIQPIEYVIVNLYPFRETIARHTVSFDEAVEQIDIGGPSMLRAAAKNMSAVTAIVDPDDYPRVSAALEQGKPLTDQERRELAAKVFRHTAAYDALIAEYLTSQTDEQFPARLTVTFERAQPLRYGENPHQRAAFYRAPFPPAGTIATARQLHGKELSYINLLDADAALALAREFGQPAVAAIKHTNPCGVGIAERIEDAYQKAYEADPVSIFGGIVAFNRPVTLPCAERMVELFLEIVIAPAFDEDALNALRRKKNLRLLEVPFPAGDASKTDRAPALGLRSVDGGLLVQERDLRSTHREDCQVVTQRAPTDEDWRQLLFAWPVVKHVKSNAIVLAREGRTVGVGAGQMNRIGAAQIAIAQAGELARGAVLASDAFFPMRDTVDAAAAAGVSAIIQPGGSIRDAESVAAAEEAGMAMVYTGTRHFRH
jgi:phosphoribosylaminoimidazolecarboxamide formyltransferase/IMP cyclohydrolase